MRLLNRNDPPKTAKKTAARKPAKRKAPARRKAPPRWRKPLIVGAGLVGLCAATAGTAAWAWTSGTITRALDTTEREVLAYTADVGLAVEEVLVVDRHNTDTDELLAAVDIEIGQPIMSFDPETAQRRLENLGWIRNASVERRLPNQVVVYLEERRPAAIWQRDKSYYLVDLEGAVINQEDVQDFTHLKVITGDDAPRHVAELLHVLEEAPELDSHVVGAMWVGDRRWNIRLQNGVFVRLPEQDPRAAWARLSQLVREHELLNREVEAIDLRQKDRLVIKMTRAGAQLLMAPEEDT